MLAGLAIGLALAAPYDALPRADQKIVERRYARLSGAGPAWGIERRATGPVRAWVFPDGVVEHAEFLRGKSVIEVRRYGPSGEALTTLRLSDGAPKEVVVSGAEAIDVSAWEERVQDGVRARWPAPDPGRHLATLVSRTPADPRSDAVRDSLAEWCACLLEDRDTAWLDGVPGVVYRVRLPHPEAAWVGEVWVVSDGVRALALASLVPADADGLPVGGKAALAPGRAVAATVAFEEAP